MATIAVEDNQLVLQLADVEKVEAAHGDLKVPLSDIRDINVINDAKEMTRIKTGFKVGMRVPGRASVAVVRRPGYKAFVAIHHDTPRAIRVVLKNNSYNEWIVGADDPDSMIASLKLNK